MQETVDPLRGVGRWLAYGAAGAFCLGLGLVIVLLGVLRVIEEEWHRSSSGSWSWVAYLITLLVAVGMLVRHVDADQEVDAEQGTEVGARTMSDQHTKITPEDLERKLRALQGDVQDAVDDKKPAARRSRRRRRGGAAPDLLPPRQAGGQEAQRHRRDSTDLMARFGLSGLVRRRRMVLSTLGLAETMPRRCAPRW